MKLFSKLYGRKPNRKFVFRVPIPSWLCYSYSLEHWNYLDRIKSNSSSSLFSVLKWSTWSLVKNNFTIDGKLSKLRLFLETSNTNILVSTRNQYNALEYIIHKSEGVSISIGGVNLNLGVPYISDFLTTREILGLGAKYIPLIMFEYLFTQDKYIKESIKQLFKDYVYCYGIYSAFGHVYKKSRIKYLYYSNDHVGPYRAAFLAANKFISTIYVSHANVSFYFPPLECTYALLAGDDMVMKYSEIARKYNFNNKVSIFKIGNQNIDKALSLYNDRKNFTAINLGVCVNPSDIISKVVDLIRSLDKLKYKLFLRVHPNDKRCWKKEVEGLNIEYTVEYESIYDFMCRIDIILSGPSNILMEAKAYGVASYQVNIYEGNLTDNYNFISNNHVRYIEDNKNLIELLVKYKSSNYRDNSHHDIEVAGYYFENIKVKTSSQKLTDIAYKQIICNKIIT